MTTASSTMGRSANSATATSCGRKRNYLRFGPRIIAAVRAIYPSKTARWLADLTGDPVRTWEYWLSKERLTGEALGALIASEHGEKYVEALAGQSVWWRAIQRKLAAADEREHKLQEAMHAFRLLAATEDVGGLPNVAGAADSALVSRRTTPKA